MPSELAEKQCKPCEGEGEPLKGEELEEYKKQLPEGWQVVDDHHLEKEFEFDEYQDGAYFVVKAANVASEQQHHPDLLLQYKKVKVTIWTHKIGGLSENDFILAAKIEEIG